MNDPLTGSQIPSLYIPTEGQTSIDETTHVSSLPLAQDKLATSTADAPTLRPALPQAPVIPTPSVTVQGAAMKTAAQQMEKNPWLNSPSFLAKFMTVMLEVLDLQTELHFDEAQIEAQTRGFMYDLGKGNAEIAKALKQSEAHEQLVQAATSFTSAAVAGGQAFSSVQEKGAATKQVHQEITDLKAKKDAIKPIDPPVVAGHAPPAAADIATLTPAQKKEVAKLDTLIQQKEATETTDIHRITEHATQITQQKGQVLTHTVQGAGNLASASLKEEQGELQKQKELQEALMQMYRAHGEGAKSSKEGAIGSVDKAVELIARMFADTVRAHQLRNA